MRRRYLVGWGYGDRGAAAAAAGQRRHLQTYGAAEVARAAHGNEDLRRDPPVARCAGDVRRHR